MFNLGSLFRELNCWIWGGNIAKVSGTKKTIVMLSSFVTLGFLLMIPTKSPWILLIAFLFTGISQGSISNFNHAMVNEVSNSSPSAFNFLHSIYAVGAIIAPMVVLFSTKWMGDEGWKLTALFMAVMTFVSVLLFSKLKVQ